jgi:hypothetical protein
MSGGRARSRPEPPLVGIDASVPDGESLRALLEARFGSQIRVAHGVAGAVAVRLVGLEELPDEPSGEKVVVIADFDLPQLVAHMGPRPFLNHVVCRRAIDHDVVMAVLWRLAQGTTGEPAHLLSPTFSGRSVILRSSEKRDARIEAIASLATDCGMSGRAIARVIDVAEELITNALYDAPAERTGVPAQRAQPVVLERPEASRIVYGADDRMFYLRVRDPFGALRRRRLFEVLSRCVLQGGVPLDSSRGGAGLGLLRIFESAALVVVHVRKDVSTEFLVGLDVKRRRGAKDRVVHLFFEGEES